MLPETEAGTRAAAERRRRRRDAGGTAPAGPTQRARGATACAAWVALSALVALGPSRAVAQPSLQGSWQAGPTSVQVTVESWGPDCPRRPTSTTRPGEGRIPVRVRGDHVELGGAVGLGSDTCWSPNRALRRVSTTHRGDTWVTQCRTSAEDGRVESGTYTLRRTAPTRLEREGVSRYDWTLNESRCIATVVERQSFTRLPDEGSAARASTGTAPAEAPGADCIPGPPARIRIRPEVRAVEPGGRVCFRAVVVDAAGCPAPSSRVDLRLQSPAGVTGQLRGRCFEAGDTAATAEGTFQVIARAGELEETATVVVRTSDLSDLRAKRIAHGAAGGADGDAEAGGAARLDARAADGQNRQAVFWIALGAGLALLALAAASGVLVVRRRAAAPAMPRGASAPPPGTGRPPPPTTGSAPPAGSLPPPAASRPPATSVPPPTGERQGARICPICRRGFPESARFCPHDSAELVPWDAWARERGASAEHTLRCPRCGTTYPAGTRFCGVDGETLAPLK